MSLITNSTNCSIMSMAPQIVGTFVLLCCQGTVESAMDVMTILQKLKSNQILIADFTLASKDGVGTTMAFVQASQVCY